MQDCNLPNTGFNGFICTPFLLWVRTEWIISSSKAAIQMCMDKLINMQCDFKKSTLFIEVERDRVSLFMHSCSMVSLWNLSLMFFCAYMIFLRSENESPGRQKCAYCTNHQTMGHPLPFYWTSAKTLPHLEQAHLLFYA